MKKETSIIIAGTLGVLGTLGLFFLKRFLTERKYDSYYNDFHQHFVDPINLEEHHGVEYQEMR